MNDKRDTRNENSAVNVAVNLHFTDGARFAFTSNLGPATPEEAARTIQVVPSGSSVLAPGLQASCG